MRLRLPIGLKLPLFISGLLVVVIGGFSWVAYTAVQRSAIDAAAERLERVASQLHDNLSSGLPQRFAEVKELAARPAVRRYLRDPTVATRAAALAALARLSSLDSPSAALEVWDSRGLRVLAVGLPLPPLTLPAARALGDSADGVTGAAIGPLRLVGDSLFFPVIAPVDNGLTGYVVNWRRVRTSPQALTQIREFVGSDAALFLGNTQGDLWTDLLRPVEGPPGSGGEREGLMEYERPGRGWFLAWRLPIRGTPWLLLVEFSRGRVLASARILLRRLAAVALGLIAVGGVGAWVVERRLQASEGRLSAIVRAALDAHITMDDRGTIVTWNPQAEAVFGWPARDVIGRHVADVVVPPGHREAHWRGLTAFLESGEGPILNRRLELLALRRDGTELPVELAVTPIRLGNSWIFSAFVRDISERKVAEDALRRSEERYRLLFDSGPHPMWVYDVDTLRFVTVNDAAVRHYGYTRDEFLTMTIEDIRPTEDVPALREHLAQVRATGASRPAVWRHRKKDGTIIQVEVVRYTLQFEGRRAALVLAQDVTERDQLEHQLRQAQKMEAVGRLAGGIAHDFNNLLTAIFGYADLLAEDLPPDSPGRADVTEIRTAATRASALTRQLLAFSRQQVLQPVVLNLNDVVEDLEKMLQRVLGEDIELEAHFAPDLGNTQADPGQLEQVIVNLAVNARDAMPTGGKLTIETANMELGEDYAERHRPVVPGRYVMVAVSDTGTGMDAATQARIFEPFFTTKEPGKGTGLGLATAYGIVKQSGGYIWVYSEVGQGATFKIYLPRVDASVEAVVPPPALETVAGKETVLLAEDDPLLLPLARAVLSRLGYTVLEARTPADAVAVAQAHAGVIHLLISDVVMPGESGLQLARRLLQVRPKLRVLYISGYSDEAIVRHGLLDPGTTFLQKPFTPTALARKVRELLDAP